MLDSMEDGTYTSIQSLISDIYRERGYSFIHVDPSHGYVWTKDSGKTYSIKDWDQIEILNLVDERGKDRWVLDFSEYADEAVGLPYNLQFCLRSKKGKMKA